MLYMILVLSIICLSYFIYLAYKNTKDIKINKIKINSNNFTASNKPLSILHLSDLHLENISLSANQLKDKLANESVDLIALTGDFLDRKRTIPKLIPYLRVLNDLNPKHGIYAVFGNHDYVLKGDDLRRLKYTLEEFGCIVLQNESKTITFYGQTVNIIGIDDFSTNRSDVAASYRNVKEGKNIVLTHDPNIVLHMGNYTFDYLMAGHFHGGQICYPKAYHLVKMGKLARKNIIKGLHIHERKPFYISEGLGQTGINIRIGSRPEITFHDVLIHD